MRYYLLFIFSIFISVQGRAGYIAYYNLVNEGEYHMYEGQYELAINNFEMAFELVDQPKGRDYFCMAKCQSQMGNLDQSLYYLTLAKQAGCSNEFIHSDSLWFTQIYSTPLFKEILLIEVLPGLFEEDSIAKIKFQFLLDMEDSQMIFYKFRRKNQPDTISEEYRKKESDYQVYLKKYVEGLNDFILTGNWPKTSKNASKMSMLCRFYLSSDIPAYDSIINALRIQLDSGYIAPYYFALIHEAKDPLNQLYGLPLNSIHKNKINEILVNRKSIGLSTYYCKSPDYKTNYKPTPIIFNVKQEQIENFIK